MPKRKSNNMETLIKLQMAGAHNFYEDIARHYKRFDYRIVDIADGTLFLALIAIQYHRISSADRWEITRPNKEMLMAAIQCFGNSSARYQVVTEDIWGRYQRGEYKVDKVTKAHVQRARHEQAKARYRKRLQRNIDRKQKTKVEG